MKIEWLQLVAKDIATSCRPKIRAQLTDNSIIEKCVESMWKFHIQIVQILYNFLTMSPKHSHM